MGVSNQAFPRLDTQAVDPRTGQLTQPWYRFFISLWTRSGGGVGYDLGGVADQAEEAFLSSLMDDAPPPYAQFEIAGEERSEPASQINPMGDIADDPADISVPAVQAITLGASPAAFTARKYGFLLIAGGTVSAVAMTRGGVSTSFPSSAYLVPLSGGDTAMVTYTAAPTVTFVPR